MRTAFLKDARAEAGRLLLLFDALIVLLTDGGRKQ
jgi:hypothetical protein